MKTIMLSVVHQTSDVRIFFKEALTVARAGHAVSVIALSKESEKVVDGVRTVGLPPARSHWGRPLNWLRLFGRAVRERADIYHFHDPELLPWGVLLQWVTGKAVIYDAHEYYPSKVLARPWIPAWLRPLVGRLVYRLEPFFARALAGTIAADQLTSAALEQRGVHPVVTLYNYPRLDVCAPPDSDHLSDLPAAPTLLFIGMLGPERGLWTMLDTVAWLREKHGLAARLIVVGDAKLPGLVEQVEARTVELGIADSVSLEGYVPHDALATYLRQAHLGFMAYDPAICERNIPTKMFEYMAAGLPIITTRANMTAFFLDQTPAGIMVDSQHPEAYAQAIVDLWSDPGRLREMARAGRRAFETRYHWESEEEKLLALYQRLSPRQRG